MARGWRVLFPHAKLTSKARKTPVSSNRRSTFRDNVGRSPNEGLGPDHEKEDSCTEEKEGHHTETLREVALTAARTAPALTAEEQAEIFTRYASVSATSRVLLMRRYQKLFGGLSTATPETTRAAGSMTVGPRSAPSAARRLLGRSAPSAERLPHFPGSSSRT